MTPVARGISAVISFYQRSISPRFAPRCRYYPSCSSYAMEAVQVHGASKGTLVATWRILRCNPWSKGGADYVPEKGAWPGKPLGHGELLNLWDEEEAKRPAASGENNSGEDSVPPPAQQDTNIEAPRERHDSETRKN
ncbi:membrane protein insertion efficiency factor YidD [Flaviflexus huanghaiensis]|uniref:membrane protein insertion efficiency factor YidD n=1 Tax=Flaviflexus huanghaiensis TaxID=1111473 RepID=UPI0015F8CE3C|nr:membrane protein insertion efficiency factor YidD [Flaviflexus huanghaiensis]